MPKPAPSNAVVKGRTQAVPKAKQDGRKLDLQVTPEQGRRIAGSADPDFLGTLTRSLAAATPGQGSDIQAVNAGLAALAGIEPRDELEAMLAAQMTTVHSMAMEMSKRALLPEQTVEGVSENVKRATRLMGVFTRQVEALTRYRTGGQQRVVVERVTVSEGGQAMFGNVNQGGGGDG